MPEFASHKASALPGAASALPPSVIRAVAKTVGSRFSWILINAMTGMITAHALGASGRGALAAIIMWPVFLAGTLTFGLPSALVYHLRRAGTSVDRVSLFTAATILATIIGAAASVAGFFILPWWLSNYSPQVLRWTQWMILFTLVSMLTLIFRAAFEAIENFGRSASSWLLSPLQTLMALAVLWHFHLLTELTAALSYVLAGLPVLLWMIIRLTGDLGWGVRHFRQSSRTLLSYGIRSYGIDLCGMLSQSIDQALVVGMISPSEMGLYVVALSLSRTVNAVYQAAAAVLFPRCVGMTSHTALAATLRMTLGCTLLVLPGAVILYSFGSQLLHLFYGPEYVVATLLFRVLLFEALLSGITTLMSQPFMALGKPGAVTLLQAAGLGAAIPLLLILVPRFGTVGAGIALLGSAFLRFLLLLGSYIRLAGRLPRRTDLRYFTDSIALGHRLVRLTATCPPSEQLP